MRRASWTVLPLLLGACVPKVGPAPGVPPLAVAEVERPVEALLHTLEGRIWRASDGTFVEEATLVEALRGADVALLGEKHDNPEHHRLQARMITVLAANSVAFEMLDADDDVEAATSAQELAQAVEWDESGWPEFDLYRPVFEAVYASGARPVAAHPTAEHISAVMSEGMEGINNAGDGLALDRAPVEAQLQSLQQEIVRAHCGYADAGLTAMMVSAQVLKDAWMARTLAELGPGSALVAGNGHTRPDRGVPSYLDASTVVLSFREVQHGEENPEAYVDGGADFIWFTSRLDDEEPCEAFRAQLEGMQSDAMPTQ